MVFQGEDVPLTEDILKKKKEFVKTWLEWAAENREQVIRSGKTGSGSTITLFTVPDKNTLFITNTWFAHTNTGGASAGNNRYKIGNDFIYDFGLIAVAGSRSVSNSHPMPLRVQEKQTITITSSTNYLIQGGFQGFLEPKKIT